MTPGVFGILAGIALALPLLPGGARAASWGGGSNEGLRKPPPTGSNDFAADAWAARERATQGREAPQPPERLPAGAQERQGQVQGIDPRSATLTLSDGSAILVGPKTQVVKDGRIASLEEIQEGDHVRATFTPGSTHVQLLLVTSP
jgi:hypothetical protein